MDKTPLVANDFDIEGRVVSALSKAQIPVTAVDWDWVPQLEEWQLIVVTSLHDTRGPREAYARILEALLVAGVYQSIPLRKLFVKSPRDPAAQKLVQELKLTTEGNIHITRHTEANGRQQYSVVYAPYVGSGGAIPSKRLEGDDELRVFLQKHLGIHPYTVDKVLLDLTRMPNATVSNVQMSLRRAKRLNLAA